MGGGKSWIAPPGVAIVISDPFDGIAECAVQIRPAPEAAPGRILVGGWQVGHSGIQCCAVLVDEEMSMAAFQCGNRAQRWWVNPGAPAVFSSCLRCWMQVHPEAKALSDGEVAVFLTQEA